MRTHPSRSFCGHVATAAVLLLAGLAALPPSTARAQIGAPTSGQTPPAVEEPSGPQPLPASQISLKAEETAAVLKSLRDRPDLLDEIEDIRTSVPEALGQYQDLLQLTEEALSASASPRRAEDLKRRWRRADERIEQWLSQVNKRAQSLDRDLETLQDLRAVWELTGAAGEQAELQEAQLTIITNSVQAIRELEERFGNRRSELLSLQDQLRSATDLIDAGLTQLDAYRQQYTARLMQADAEPFWTMMMDLPPPTDHLTHFQDVWRDNLEDFRGFVAQYQRELTRHGLLFVALLLSLLLLRYQYRRQELPDSPAEAVRRVIDRPFSAALAVNLTLVMVLFQDAPRIVDDVALVLILVPLFRILPPVFPSGVRRQSVILAGLVLAARVEDMLTFLSPLQRLVLLLITSLAIWGAYHSWRSSSDPEFADGVLGHRYVRVGLVLMMVVLAAALTGNLLGYVTLSGSLTNAAVFSAFAAVILFALYHVVSGIIWIVLATPWARRLRLVERNDKLIHRRSTSLVGWVLGIYWLVVSLDLLKLRFVVVDGIWYVLTAQLRFGDVGVSLWDLASFVIIVWAAFTLSRFLRFILEEDIYWRFRVARGIPHAVSTSLHYVIVLVGFILAMAAAGIDLTKFSLLAGAFGVGLGFGMQNIVNNFISGLILIAERPIMPGDTVQIGELMGEVKRIGMRSSTVRTWAGAEVIVPNGNLISQEVINWTLSDQQRRVDVQVGVAYGSDTGQVMYLLTGVATEHKDVLDTPPPMVLFLGFGDSALLFELRAWTGQEKYLRIRSELTLAVEQALREAGITIPFPQRDLHVKSMSSDAQDALLPSKAPRERPADNDPPPSPNVA